MMKQLIVEAPNQEAEVFPWDSNTQRRFKLDDDDIKALEHGAVVWLGQTGLSLENPNDR